MAEAPEMLVSVTKVNLDALANLIADKVVAKLTAVDDAAEAAARPVDDCPTCGERGLELSTHGAPVRTFACKRGCGQGQWTAEWT